MICQAVQNQLLALPDPSRPGVDLRDHLQACAACRQWQHRLLQIERNVPVLPVPSSTGQKAFLRQFLAGSGDAPVVVPPPKKSGLEKLALGAWPPGPWGYAAAAVAAVVLVSLGSWALWRPRELPVLRAATKAPLPDPFVASLMQRDLRLAVAETGRERLEVLSDLADDLFQETRQVVRGARAEDLDQMAQLYEKVVQEGIVHLSRAPSLRAADRRQVLAALADRLAQAGREADRLARGAPQNAVRPLQVIGAAARDADNRLRGLVGWLPGSLFPRWSGGTAVTLVLVLDLEDVSAPMGDPHQWQQLTRNRGLIQALVDRALVLASEEDPLRRADQCNGLAKHLVDEIQQAADREEDGRAAELGGHLHDLLRGGVVSNLETVRQHTPPDSTRNKELRRVSEDAHRVTDPLEKLLQTIATTDSGELRRVLQAIHDTRAEVEKLLKSPVKQ
jgi:hypothetical protein